MGAATQERIERAGSGIPMQLEGLAGFKTIPSLKRVVNISSQESPAIKHLLPTMPSNANWIAQYEVMLSGGATAYVLVPLSSEDLPPALVTKISANPRQTIFTPEDWSSSAN